MRGELPVFALLAGLNVLLPLAFAPALLGIINRTKAWFAGRTGPPLLQPYYDLGKLLHKGAVYSRTTTPLFRAGPVVSLAATSAALLLLPSVTPVAFLSFPGSLLVLAGLLALVRCATVLAALDTGSAFEGMGASREVLIGALAEPALLMGLATVAAITGSASLAESYARLGTTAWLTSGPSLLLAAGALLLVFLAENARVPVDDPNTHLELTMIHEVMVLDHSGPDFGFITYGAALKLWILGVLIVGLFAPAVLPGAPAPLALAGAAALRLLGLVVLAVLVGVIESSMARLRMIKLPQLLVAASAFAGLGLLLVLR